MKPNPQPTLPTLTDWNEPQIVKGADLAQAIGRAAAAGYRANTMIALKGFRYALRFERAHYATETTQNNDL